MSNAFASSRWTGYSIPIPVIERFRFPKRLPVASGASSGIAMVEVVEELFLSMVKTQLR